jgi:protein TonB
VTVAAASIRIVARLGGPSSELSPFVVGSLVVHFVLAGGLILMPSLRPRKPFPDNPIRVHLVAAARPAATAAAAPPVPQTEPAEGVRLETREPEIKPLPRKPDPPPEKKQQPRRPASPPTPASEPAAAGPAAGVAGEEGGGSITALEGGDVQFAWYRDSVTASLYSHWRRPILSGLLEPVEVRVTFEILRDGGLRDLRVEESSGVAVFDRSALRAVSDAAPLPPLPSSWREPTLPAAFVFRLFPE